ncbi:hypothetical protein [Erythrobacter sp. EC-HK427]|uniref:hypothetical protein n=1 Tax=Erythrobacter sp. EC-HK427 TaxID=2038396 RepID=UPI001256AAC9|nr:hypothetical protein [Erythrobacter sp. EC-HK427]VVT03873.1 hypothetical protein ERY430_41015 [Erythrobacter sp. EC-HK427]
MSPKARYRLANWSWWLALALFAFLAIYLPSKAPWGDAELLLFLLAFAAAALLIIFIPLFALIAWRTVYCGECGGRFFDPIFITFPVQGGCKNCRAPIENAVID